MATAGNGDPSCMRLKEKRERRKKKGLFLGKFLGSIRAFRILNLASWVSFVRLFRNKQQDHPSSLIQINRILINNESTITLINLIRNTGMQNVRELSIIDRQIIYAS